MSSKHLPAGLLLLAALAVASLGWRGSGRAVAQGPGTAAGGRYQVSPYAFFDPRGQGSNVEVCYLIDTMTGKLWRLRPGVKGNRPSEWVPEADAPTR